MSDMLSALEVGASGLCKFDMRGDWGVEVDRLPFATSWTVLEGTVWMLGPKEGPIQFHRGDTVVMPRGIRCQPYVLVSSPDVQPVHIGDLWRHAEMKGFGFGDASSRVQHVVWGGTGDASCIVSTAFSFNNEQLGPLIAALPERMIVRASETLGKGQLIDSLLRLAVDEEDASLPGFSALVIQAIRLLLVHVVRTHALSMDKGAIGALAGLTDVQIGRALACMHREPETDWTVAALARQAGLSRSVFAERFLARVGQTPMQYLRVWRMNVARKALASGKKSIMTLAHDLGYHSEAAFRTAFRRAFGRSPREFRGHVESQRAQKVMEDLAMIWGPPGRGEHKDPKARTGRKRLDLK